MTKKRRKSTKSKRTKLTYRVHGLDVWGNKNEGFQVNDVYPSQGTIEFPEDASYAEIVRALKREGFLKRNLSVTIDGERGYTMYVEDARIHRPEYELRPVKDDES